MRRLPLPERIRHFLIESDYFPPLFLSTETERFSSCSVPSLRLLSAVDL